MTYFRPKRSPNVGEPCSCLECQAAGVTDLPIIRVPGDKFMSTPHWLHGEQLKAWYEAREKVLAGFRALKESHSFGGGRS